MRPVSLERDFIEYHQKRGDRMRIGFIGAGKVGFTLGKYFVEHGTEVTGYYSAHERSAKEAAEFTHTRYYAQLEDITDASDALFLTCPDGAIESVWNSLKRYNLKGKCICHCSGALSSAVFSDSDRSGVFGYSIHPLFAVNSKKYSYREISKAYFTIEGNEKYIDYWTQLFEGFGNPVKIITADNKVIYHSAAVFVSNLVCGLFNEGVELMKKCGFDEASAKAAISPIFLNNAKTLAENGAVNALTGPLERGDAETISKHLKALPKTDAEIYRVVSRALTDVAKRKNPDRDYSGICSLLEKEQL